MSNATATRHLTPAQRQALRELFDDADTKELLQAIAGIVRHDVADCETAENAADAIVFAARMIKWSGKPDTVCADCGAIINQL